MHIIATGATNNFWSLDTGSRQLQGDYPFMKEEASFGRFGTEIGEKEVAEELETNIPWDCECGLGVFGQSAAVEKVFEQLKRLMLDSVNEADYAYDLMNESNPTRLALYSIQGTDFKVVIGAGYYCESTQECHNIIENAKNVYAIESGANFGTGDDDPIGDFITCSKEDEDFPQNLMPLVAYFEKNSMC